MPRVRGKLLTKFEESFVIKAAKLWNVLPGNLTHIPDLTIFKAALDEYLFTLPDKPPILGYPYQTNNSLTSVIK